MADDVDNTPLDSDNLFNGAKSLSDEDKSFLQLEIERVRAEGEAVKAEFVNAMDADPENGAVDELKLKFAEQAPDAVTAIVHAMTHGSTEQIRFQAAKYIADVVLGSKGSRGSDPKDKKFDDFLKDVFGNTKSSELPAKKGYGE